MHDVLILGGGVIGLSLAYELVRDGLQVRLLDRGTPAREASWAGAGILPPAQQVPGADPLEQLAGLSARLHPQWAERLRDETGVNTGFRRCGGLYLATETDAARELSTQALHWRSQGIEVEAVDGARLAELEPALADGAAWLIRGGIFAPEECQLRNPWHARALWTACQTRGVDILADTAADEFVLDGDRLAGVATRAGVLEAGAYVLTSGAWTAGLAARLGIQLPLKPIRGQIVLYQDAPAIERVVNVGPRYLVPRGDGRVLAGSTEEDVGFEKANTPEAIAALQKFAAALAPGLRQARVETTWSGLRPASADGRPFLGRLPGFENAFVAAGHFRAGLQLSPATAVVMSQLIRGETPEVDLSAFAVDRSGG